jgi:sigma-B regulation protein RsbQ
MRRTKSHLWVGLAVLAALLAGCSRQPSEPAAPEPSFPQVIGMEGEVPSFDGVPVAFSSEGEGPTTLLLVHGWACNRTHWANQVKELAKRYRVVTVDLPGHGSSGMDRTAWTLAAFGRDLRAVVDTLDLERVILVGHSMGGPVALEAARLLPDRVIGVVGVDTLHNVEWRFDDEWKALLAAYEKDFRGTCDRFGRSMFRPDTEAELVTRVVDEMCEVPPEVGITLLRQFETYDPAAALAAAEVPVRCINTDGFPTEMEVNRKYAPDFDAVIMQGVGHFPMLERPEEFTRLLLDVVEELERG